MKHINLFAIVLTTILLNSNIVSGQVVNDTTKKLTATSKKWFESINIRGYAQIRYNGLLQTNEDLGCEQCDKSWGGDNGFFIRRMRVIIYGQISPRVYLYVQPDFASAPSSSTLHFAQLRDAYFDLGLDKDNEFRLRIGQSKVPYGFENMQSSQNLVNSNIEPSVIRPIPILPFDKSVL